MALIALLTPPVPGMLSGLPTVAGRPVLERQRRQSLIAGVERIVIWSDATSDTLAQIADDDVVLVLSSGLVVDERIVAAVLAASVPAVATWPAVGAHKRAGVERLDALTVAAGVATYPGAMVRRLMTGLGDWDLHSTLLRAALADEGATRVDLSAIDLYAPARRRFVPLVWTIPETPAEASEATTLLIGAAQKGCLDWPARFIHPPIENMLVRLLAPTPITPNMVTLFVLLVSIGAGVAFVFGWMWTGLALALFSGPLDGVDGKLARARLEFSRWGDLEHVLDKISEYGWYLCLAGHFAAQRGGEGPWTLAALIILVALAESLQGEFFRRFTGKQLDDAGDFERRFRLVSGRRNTFFWTLIPFGIAGAWYGGFILIAVYSVVTFAVMQASFYKRMAEFGRIASPVVDRNFSRTAYAFLPGKDR